MPSILPSGPNVGSMCSANSRAAFRQDVRNFRVRRLSGRQHLPLRCDDGIVLGRLRQIVVGAADHGGGRVLAAWAVHPGVFEIAVLREHIDLSAVQRGLEPRLHQTELLGALDHARFKFAPRRLEFAQGGLVGFGFAAQAIVDLGELPRGWQPHQPAEPIADRHHRPPTIILRPASKRQTEERRDAKAKYVNTITNSLLRQFSGSPPSPTPRGLKCFPDN